VFLIELSKTEFSRVAAAPTAFYQAARWIKQFHAADYSNIGWMDHGPETRDSDVIAMYGFIAVPEIELNRIRLLLETYGPLLAVGALSHLPQHEVALASPGMSLVQVSCYENDGHSVVLNGYVDGFRPRLLYVDTADPGKQFVLDFSDLQRRLLSGIPLFYLNCGAFPKPCPHVANSSTALSSGGVVQRRPRQTVEETDRDLKTKTDPVAPTIGPGDQGR
jgi:hypothetical protein